MTSAAWTALTILLVRGKQMLWTVGLALVVVVGFDYAKRSGKVPGSSNR